MKIGIASPANQRLASTRFRLHIPSKHVPYKYDLGIGDITIIPKHSITLADARKVCGKTVTLWDVSDDHFNDAWRNYYLEMAKMVDYISCTTPFLAERIQDETNRDAFVISDPLEFGKRPPKVDEIKKLLWYGHHSNLDPLLELNLDGYELMIISSKETEWALRWSEENMRIGFDWCDAVIIPVGEGLEKKSKSPNRMTEAINAGRYVIANPMPAYHGYGMYQGEILEGLSWLKSHRKEALEQLTAAQEIVTRKHSPEAIGAQWKALFDSILVAGKSCGKDSSTSIFQTTGLASSQMSNAI